MITIDIDAAKEEEAAETYGIYLNGTERRVFELAHKGLPARRIAEALEMQVGLVRKMLTDGTPVRDALRRSNQLAHRESQERRETLLRMALDEMQDQLSRPDTEISPEAKREIVFQVFDRMGLPRVTQQKTDLRGSIAHVQVLPGSVAELQAQAQALLSAKAQVIDVLAGEPSRSESG